MELETGLRRLQSLAVIAKAIAITVAASQLLCAVAIILTMNGAPGYDTLPGTGLTAIDTVVLVTFVILLTSFFAVGFWLYRAHANAIAAGVAALEYSPGWAIAWYAIPIANLFKPYGAMKELWQVSHREQVDSSQTAPALIWVWWLTWVFSSINGLNTTEAYNFIDAITSVLTAVSAGALFVIIDRITVSQANIRSESVFE
jgi:hypothetical protein